MINITRDICACAYYGKLKIHARDEARLDGRDRKHRG